MNLLKDHQTLRSRPRITIRQQTSKDVDDKVDTENMCITQDVNLNY